MGLHFDASGDQSIDWFWQFHRAGISHQATVFYQLGGPVGNTEDKRLKWFRYCRTDPVGLFAARNLLLG